LLWAGVVSATSAQDAAIATRLDVPTGTPLLVEHEAELAFEIERTPGASSFAREFRIESESRFLDEVQLLDGSTQKGTRGYLECRELDGGKISDPPYAGITLRYTGDGRTREVELVGDRRLPAAHLDRLLSCFDSLWIWLRFPDELRLGETFELDLLPLAPILFGDDLDHREAAARMSFDAYDEETATASFSGRATGKAELPLDWPFDGTLAFEGKLEIQSVPGEGRIAAIAFDGDASMAALTEEDEEVRGRGTLVSRLETRIRSDARKLLRRKPKFRTAVRRAEAFGLSLEVPSYWARIDLGDDLYNLLRTVDAEQGEAFISLERISEPNSRPEAYLRRVVEYFDERYEDYDTKSVSCPLGKGMAVILTKIEDEEEKHIRSEFYPHRNGWLVFKLSGDAQACKKALKEYDRARRTLKAD
jgi:hypothetical protein